MTFFFKEEDEEKKINFILYIKIKFLIEINTVT